MKFIGKLISKIKPYLKWKFLLVYLIPWFLCTGWTYVVLLILAPLGLSPTWLTATAGTVLAVFWMPGVAESVITIPLTLLLYRIIFKEDFKGGEK